MRSITFIIFSVGSVAAFAQIGGKRSFDFLNVPYAARLSALGGVNVSLTDRDVNLFAGNPALSGDTLSGFASAGYQFYLADIGQAVFSYANNFRRIGTLMFSINHLQYGAVQGYDANGIETDRFRSGETALIVGKNHQVGNFRMGANIKTVFSNLAGNRASAILVDLGGVFIHPHQHLTVGMTIKNIGFVLDQYSSTSHTKLPFDVQVGTTFKPEHMPLRFSLTAFNLTKADVTYYNVAADNPKPRLLNKVLSHIILGTEILIHKNVTIMAGYNYLAHHALKLNGGGAGAGVSAGFSAAIKSFELVFSRGGYVAGNAGYSFTLSSDINNLLKRR